MELHRIADKLRLEQRHLEHILDDERPDIRMALMVAKRVRRESTLLVRALASERDNATAQEGASNDD